MNLGMWAGVVVMGVGLHAIWMKHRRGRRYRRLRDMKSPNVFVRESLPHLAPYYEIQTPDLFFPVMGTVCFLMSL
jgi:hypothetical protein